MKKLKDLLKESFVWEREFGEKLPTIADTTARYTAKQEGKLNEAMSKEKIDVEIIAKKMEKDKTFFGPGWAKAIRKQYKKGVSEYDLQMDLPDYISGGAIFDLFRK